MKLRESNKGIKWPTLMNFVMGSFVGRIIPRAKNASPKDTIDKYNLVSTVGDKLTSGFYEIGIYEYDGTKFLIKTWRGLVKDSDYYTLLREYLVGDLLNRKIRELEISTHVCVPKVIDLFITRESLSVVFEYVEGAQHIVSLDKNIQLEIIDRILVFLKTISDSLTLEEKNNIGKRGPAFHFISTLAASIIVVYKHPAQFLNICRAMKYSLKSLINIYHRELGLAHRDLSFRNILVRGSEVYLIDCGGLSMTLPSYDVSRLATNKGLDLIREELANKVSGVDYGLSRTYIIMHSIVGDSHVKYLRDYYISIINKYE